MLDPGVLAFARGALPAPPARILEIGAGAGELAAALREGGLDVTAIDPNAENGTDVERVALIDADGDYDAAIAVVSLHHVEPLAQSCAHLAELIEPGGVLAIDELDIRRYDERATAWWLHQRSAAGHDDDHTPESILDGMRGHIHALDDVLAALAPHFALGEPVRGPYLHRWHLPPGLREVEERLIGSGDLPATGARLVGIRRH
jgi:SAM-dependent methyltransferase